METVKEINGSLIQRQALWTLPKSRWYRTRKWFRRRKRAMKEWWESQALFGGRASRHHYHEAKERYHSLKSITENSLRKLKIDLPDEDDGLTPQEVCNYLSLQFEQMRKDNQQVPDPEDCNTLISSWKTLIDIKRYLTRRPEHLNNLWRTMTRIRLDLMEAGFLTNNPTRHLYFCKEEAHRLGVRNDPEVKNLIEQLGEAITPNASQTPQFVCIYRACLERFNTIRTGRIHQQYINVKIYMRAFVMLLVFGVPLLLYGDFFLGIIPGKESYSASSLLEMILTYNRLTFVFFGGLLGGVFSVTMRERPRERAPGDDAYQVKYIITKPFIGAMGAVFIYILVVGGLFSTELVKDHGALLNRGALTFGFAFMAGFTERLVFPSFR
jgi:hypothetical protein